MPCLHKDSTENTCILALWELDTPGKMFALSAKEDTLFNFLFALLHAKILFSMKKTQDPSEKWYPIKIVFATLGATLWYLVVLYKSTRLSEGDKAILTVISPESVYVPLMYNNKHYTITIKKWSIKPPSNRKITVYFTCDIPLKTYNITFVMLRWCRILIVLSAKMIASMLIKMEFCPRHRKDSII